MKKLVHHILLLLIVISFMMSFQDLALLLPGRIGTNTLTQCRLCKDSECCCIVERTNEPLCSSNVLTKTNKPSGFPSFQQSQCEMGPNVPIVSLNKNIVTVTALDSHLFLSHSQAYFRIIVSSFMSGYSRSIFHPPAV